MCCLRYEHEFYVQSRKRFPKEGKIVATKLGEEKVVSVDIFRERITLRGVEGEMRFVSLADFKRETEEQTGVMATAVASEEEDAESEAIRPEEISPELLYTAEHPVFVPPNASRFPLPASPFPPTGAETRDGATSGKRRRGRRGGRRGRGGEDPNSSGGH